MNRRSRTSMLGGAVASPVTRSGAEQTPLDISLDSLPPSLNNLYATVVVKGRSRRILSSVARDWKGAAILIIRSAARRQGWTAKRKAPLHIEIVYASPAVLRWDLDGKSKLLVDAFCEALGLDDRYVMSLKQTKARSPIEQVQMRVLVVEVVP